MPVNKGVTGLVLGLAILMAGLGTGVQGEPLNEDKPFAEQFLLLQLSDDQPEKQNMVLSVAANLLQHYGPDSIDIEITTFGPGVALLVNGNSRTELISSLMAQGVRFSVCMNTVETIERSTGRAPDLHPDSVRVQVGVAHILDQVKKGYVLVRP
ncbi:hypothetical protein LPB19_11870 [Marinobacter salinisoli]|uniref:Sulfur reduction protein DsrE n=1 Tax=Marinobacter salinisoli TaxID=2769486 RepID=A0ABX7MR37_9GAMM|nr:hypothetical protein [Marinobacter salinisoli]QSP93890.1 hypothetical protein LPB19_11870 [Marinobacter salinisoli]